MPRARGQSAKPTPGDATVAVGYVRVSTDQQELGPEAQESAIRSWAAQHAIRLVEPIHRDDLTGATDPMDRPGFQQAYALARQHRAGWLVVKHRDRVSREPMLTAATEAALHRIGVHLLTTDRKPIDDRDDPMQGMIAAITDGFGKVELHRIRQRTADALAVKKRRGEVVGSVPLGFEAVVQGGTRVLVPHQGEREAARRATELQAQGVSLRAIGRTLTAEGLPPREGGPWHHTAVRRLLVFWARLEGNGPGEGV